MKAILDFVETVYLRHMSLDAQEIWIKSLVNILREKESEISAKRRAEEIHNMLLDGDVENPDAYTKEELATAIECIRDDRKRMGGYGWSGPGSLVRAKK